MSKAQQNKLGWQLGRECLERAGFTKITLNREQGTFPHAHVVAHKGAQKYLVGVTSREEIGADGDPNPSYNVVKAAEDMAAARQMARSMGAIPAFVTIALYKEKGLYSAYFGTLDQVNFRRSIPMLEDDRKKYVALQEQIHDQRVRGLN
jgi:hypothetical protein